MKLLLVFVSALVLVAHGSILGGGKGDRVNILKLQPAPEALEGYAVEEAGDAGDVYAVEASDPELVQVFSAEEGQGAGSLQESQRAIENLGEQQLDAILERAATEGIYLPVITRSCTNSACAHICNVLGFLHGNCVSVNTCQCYN